MKLRYWVFNKSVQVPRGRVVLYKNDWMSSKFGPWFALERDERAHLSKSCSHILALFGFVFSLITRGPILIKIGLIQFLSIENVRLKFQLGRVFHGIMLLVSGEAPDVPTPLLVDLFYVLIGVGNYWGQVAKIKSFWND